MRIKLDIEILSDDQQKEQAVAAAREIVGKVLDRFKPGGAVHTEEPVVKASDIRCPECGSLYGSHAAHCSQIRPVRVGGDPKDLYAAQAEIRELKDTAVRDRAQIERLQKEVARLAELCKTYHVPTE